LIFFNTEVATYGGCQEFQDDILECGEVIEQHTAIVKASVLGRVHMTLFWIHFAQSRF
jgi:hypothetical protein